MPSAAAVLRMETGLLGIQLNILSVLVEKEDTDHKWLQNYFQAYTCTEYLRIMLLMFS